MPEYDSRYLAGVMLFNAGDYFEAHEVWEDLWAESHGNERRFYQGLIQAAVGLCHYGNGNLRGAAKLYRSAFDYMVPCGESFLGMDLKAFWGAMHDCFLPVLGEQTPPRDVRPDPDRVPRIELDPPPGTWPDPEAYIHDEE